MRSTEGKYRVQRIGSTPVGPTTAASISNDERALSWLTNGAIGRGSFVCPGTTVSRVSDRQVRQSDAIRDYVLPVVLFDPEENSIREFLGTGFVIGTTGGFLTAGHVVGDHRPSDLRVLLVQDERWVGVPVLAADVHPEQDVAFLRLDGGPWTSFFVLSADWEGASRDYQLWGYPADVARELVVESRIAERPDLVYSAGHVRRRLAAGTLPAPLATQLFEVSAPAGSGTSGAPLIRRIWSGSDWPVFGVYIGERRTNDSHVGYGAMVECFAEWTPEGSDRTVLEESQDGR